MLLVSVCDLIEAHYTYHHHQAGMTDPSPCDHVDIRVVPGNSAGNGSSSLFTGAFYSSKLCPCTFLNSIITTVAVLHAEPENFRVFKSDVYSMIIGESELGIQITNISVSLPGQGGRQFGVATVLLNNLLGVLEG